VQVKIQQRCLDEKLDFINDKVNQNALDAELHHEALENLLPKLT
jgi:hypothetical protein